MARSLTVSHEENLTVNWLFAGLIGGALAISSGAEPRRGANMAAAGMAIGGFLAGAAGAPAPPTWGYLLIASVGAGIGFAFAVPAAPATRVLLALVTIVVMPFALQVATPTCSIGGG